MLNKMNLIKLNNGYTLPPIGLGTYKLNGRQGAESITNAIEMGYRLIDSAFNYENEGTVGAGIKNASISREEIIVASKLPGRRQEYGQALYTIEESLYRAGLDYYDIYLIHWPNPRIDLYVEAWQAMIEAKKRGYVKTIGVCNFTPEYIERLKKETGVVPSINQIEVHPLFNQEELIKWNKDNGIVTEGWSPVVRGTLNNEDSCLKEIAKKNNKSITQVILRWHIQRGVIPIPKAVSKEHQMSNLEIFDFEITESEMKEIAQLTKIDGRMKKQDPEVYEEF